MNAAQTTYTEALQALADAMAEQGSHADNGTATDCNRLCEQAASLQDFIRGHRKTAPEDFAGVAETWLACARVHSSDALALVDRQAGMLSLWANQTANAKGARLRGKIPAAERLEAEAERCYAGLHQSFRW